VSHRLAPSRRRNGASSRGVCLPRRVYVTTALSRLMDCREPSLPFCGPAAYARTGPGSEVSASSPLPQHLSAAGDPLTGLGTPPECHPCATVRDMLPTHASELCRSPLPRFLPLQRLASREEPPTPRELPPHGLRCALGVSHPFDALLPPQPAGLVPSRSRSWGFPFEALLPPERRTPSRAS
jgi:hypothetical protein